MSVLMRSVSGIRGIVGDGLTPMVLVNHVRAFLECTRALKVVVGRDTRPTGEQISELVSGVCRLAGVEVVDLGVATTPTVELMVEKLGAGGGIIITASHNPIEWNALKFLGADGVFLGPEQVKELFALADKENFSWPDWKCAAAKQFCANANEIHVEAVLNLPFVDVEAIRKARFVVGIDAVNGAGYQIAPMLLEKLGCDVKMIYMEPSGRFPRGAEPLPENLRSLSNLVRQNHCHVGFALDPDADRCALVDGKGVPIGEEYTLAIAVDSVLSRKKGTVAINLSSSRMSGDVATTYGQACYRAEVGEINVTNSMRANDCIIGGEGNGGVILPALHYGRDALVAMALVLDWMARSGSGVESWVESHKSYTMIKEKFPVQNSNMITVFAEIEKLFPQAIFDRRDGLWVGLSQGWVHVRSSNTEPVLRVIAEFSTPKEAREVCNSISKVLGIGK